jgi:hypothetical protein
MRHEADLQPHPALLTGMQEDNGARFGWRHMAVRPCRLTLRQLEYESQKSNATVCCSWRLVGGWLGGWLDGWLVGP